MESRQQLIWKPPAASVLHCAASFTAAAGASLVIRGRSCRFSSSSYTRGARCRRSRAAARSYWCRWAGRRGSRRPSGALSAPTAQSKRKCERVYIECCDFWAAARAKESAHFADAGDGECERRHARDDEEFDELERSGEQRAEREHPEGERDARRVLCAEHLVRDSQVDAWEHKRTSDSCSFTHALCTVGIRAPNLMIWRAEERIGEAAGTGTPSNARHSGSSAIIMNGSTWYMRSIGLDSRPCEWGAGCWGGGDAAPAAAPDPEDSDNSFEDSAESRAAVDGLLARDAERDCATEDVWRPKRELRADGDCESSCASVQRRPEVADAMSTSKKPSKWKAVERNVNRKRPRAMRATITISDERYTHTQLCTVHCTVQERMWTHNQYGTLQKVNNNKNMDLAF